MFSEEDTKIPCNTVNNENPVTSLDHGLSNIKCEFDEEETKIQYGLLENQFHEGNIEASTKTIKFHDVSLPESFVKTEPIISDRFSEDVKIEFAEVKNEINVENDEFNMSLDHDSSNIKLEFKEETYMKNPTEFFAEDTKVFYGDSQLQNENVTNSSTRELQNGIDELSGNLPQTIATTFQENQQICDTNFILAQNRAKIPVNEVNNGILNILDVSSDEESGVDVEEIESKHDFINEQLQEENDRKTSSRTFQDLHLQSTIMPNENSQISWKGKNLEEENSHICRYFNRTVLNNHRGIDKESYKCKVCGKYYKCKPALIRLGRLHFSGTTNNESPKYNSDMNNHIRPFNCKTCSKTFAKKRNLRMHMNIHTGKKPFKCETCDKSFSQKLKLINHLRVHTGETPFICGICNKGFKAKKDIYMHMKIHTEEPFKCETCGRSFWRKINLNRHMRIHTGEKPFKCETCDRSFSEKITLDNHLKTHTGEKPFKCEMCDKSFIQKSGLNKHLTIHTGEKPFICETCGKSFRCKIILNRHRRIHTGVKPFKCETCDKSFFQKTHLNNHLRDHTGERPFKCEICNKGFKVKKHRDMHIGTHTGEKPFTCKICGQRLTKSYSLKKHMMIHTGEKPYKCEVCGKCFTQKYNLTIHLKTHTRKKPPKVSAQ